MTDNDFDDPCVADEDYVEIPDDDFLFGEPCAYSPPAPPPVMQQGMLLGPTLEIGPYQRGSGSFPTVRLYDAEGHELVWQEIYRPIEDIFGVGKTLAVTLGFALS